MKSFPYVCITKLGTKTGITKQMDTINCIMNFKAYYEALATDELKSSLRNKIVPKYISQSAFYRKKDDNTFSELEFEKLESITGQKFER